MKLDLRFHGDLGSNLMQARRGDMDPIKGWIGQQFNGYESQNRKPFTLAELQAFIYLILNHPKYEKYASVIIDLWGNEGFEEIEIKKIRDLTQPQPPKEVVVFSQQPEKNYPAKKKPGRRTSRKNKKRKK